MCNVTEGVLRLKDVTTFVLLFWIGNPIIVVGFFTSVLSFAMFTVDTFTPPTTKLMLKSMALVDAIFLVCVIGYIEFKVIYLMFPAFTVGLKWLRSHPYFTNPLSLIINMCEMFRNWLTVLMGIERYFVTCHPLKAGKFCTKKRSIIGILFCISLTLLLRIPIVIRLITKQSNDTHLIYISDISYKVHSFIDSIFLTVLPVLILTLCSIWIMKALQQSKALMKESANGKMSSTQSKVIKVTRMLMVVLIIFTLSGIPYVVYAIITFLPDGTVCSVYASVVVNICWFMSMTYSASNFFVYVIYMPKYRQILLRMLTCQKHIHDNRHMDYISLTRNHHEHVDRDDHEHKALLCVSINSQLNTSHLTPTKTSRL